MKTKLLCLLAALIFLSCSEKSLNEDSSETHQIGNEADIAQKTNDSDEGGQGSDQDQNQDQDQGKTQKTAGSDQASLNGTNIPDGQMETLYKRFNDARTRHDAESANHLAGEILSHNPNDAKVLNGLTAMAIEDGKLDLARLFIRKILEKNPTSAAAYNNLGVVELKDDNLRLALVQFKKATELDPGNRAAHANLGAIYLRYRNYQNAMVELSAAESHGDQSAATLSNLGFALKGLGNYDDAVKNYQKALAKDQNNVTIMLNYAALLVENLNKPKDGLKLLNKIRFISQEPAILNKVDVLAKKAENPKTQLNGATHSAVEGAEQGVSE